MGKRFNHIVFGLFATLMVSACASQPNYMNVAAPMPPMTDTDVTEVQLDNIPPAYGMNHNAKNKDRSCNFSSFHRESALGYEIDPSRHLALDVSPSMDIWNPSEIDAEVSLRFTKSFGGSANERPDCTYGRGFYGFLPYARHEGINLGGLLEEDNIKSYVQERLDEREQRRQDRAEALSL